MTEHTHDEFLDILEQYQREQEGGGGIIGLANFHLGFKAFLPGYSNEDSWFPFDVYAAGGREEAKVKCQVAINESGMTDKRPQLSYGFILYKDSVKGRDVTWKDDRYFTYPMWTDAARQIIKAQIATLHIAQGEFWGRWAWQEDPSGRTEVDQNGNVRTALIAYPAEVYPTEAEAEAAAGGGDVTVEAPDWLEGMVNDLKQDVQRLAVPALRAKYKVEEDVAEALKSGDKAVMAGAISGMTGESVSLIAGLL